MADENKPQPPSEDNKPQRPIGIKPITIKPKAPSSAEPLALASEEPVVRRPGETPDKTAKIESPSIHPAPPLGKPLESEPTTTTIRLKPVTPTQPPLSQSAKPPQAPAAGAPLKPLQPKSIQPPSIKPSSSQTSESAAKSKTSRISLDAAFAETPLRPKSPSGATGHVPVGKITGNLSAAADEAELTRRRTLRLGAQPEKGKTSAINLPNEPELAEAPTIRKRKTLVLKKDKAEAGATIAAGAAPQESSAGDENISAFSAFQNAAPVEKTNPVFPILAIAACLVIVALILMYMAQACGPDRSLTAFSSFTGGPNIGWPGKIM